MSDVQSVSAAGQLVTVDRSTCIGSGNCVMWAAGTFDLDDEELVVLKDDSDDTAEAVIEAARNCPVGAITAEAAD
jgi:ferredoxin